MDDSQNTPSAASGQTGGRGMNPLVPIAIIGLIVIAAIGFFQFQGQQNQPREDSRVMEQATQAPTNPDAMEGSDEITDDQETNSTEEAFKYKDGTYTAVGDYTSPGGAEQIGVTVTLEDDVIVDSEVSTEQAERPNTIRFQNIFKENYKPFVVGKRLDEVELDKVAASSLAPKGFMDALGKITTEAEV